MRIKKITIKNFRNLQKVDTSFGKINVITGKNGSGKSNLLNAIAHSLELKENLAVEFNNNITTRGGKGKSSTTISVSVDNLGGVAMSNGDSSKCIYMPDKVTFTNQIGGTDFNSQKQIFEFKGIKKEGVFWGEIDEKDLISPVNKVTYVIENEPSTRDNDEGYNNDRIRSIEGNKILQDGYARFFFHLDEDKIIHKFFKTLKNDVFVNELSSKAIIDYVLEVPSGELYELVIKRLKLDSNNKLPIRGEFSNMPFCFMLADIQSDDKQKEHYERDLNAFTNGLIRKMYIQDGSIGGNEKIGNDGMILVETPNAPRWFTSISAGSAVLIFFITLKHWLQLPFGKRSYSTPSIMLFDEIDSSIHPTLLAGFVQILRELSEKTQLIFSSHSPTFIDFFTKEEVFYLKPKEALGSIKTTKSDLLSYDQIIKCLNEDDKESFLNESNSQLFINGMIDDIYPNS